jgi:ABC-type nitrate/sulfonate/bicarbonate transport system permease component
MTTRLPEHTVAWQRLRGAAGIAAFLIGWEALSRLAPVSPALFPPPTQVASALVSLISSGELIADVASSLWRLFLGLSIGTIIGIIVGLLTGRIKTISDYLSPIIQILRPLPPVAIIPLMIVWFGIGQGSKVIAIGFACFFPAWLNSHAGASGVAQKYIWSASTFTRSRLVLFRHIILPAALPFIIVGIRSAIAVGFVMVFVSELTGASSGLGYLISISSLSYRIDRMIAGLSVLTLCGFMVDFSAVFLAKKLWPWLALESPHD